MDLHGFVVAHRSGHQLNAALVRKLLESRREGTGGPPASADTATAATASIDIGAIMKILPHRYPFLLVDRVLEHRAGPARRWRSRT